MLAVKPENQFKNWDFTMLMLKLFGKSQETLLDFTLKKDAIRKSIAEVIHINPLLPASPNKLVVQRLLNLPTLRYMKCK